MKNLMKLVLAAVFSFTAVAAFANTDGEEKPNTKISSNNEQTPPVPAPQPTSGSGGCGCGKPKTT